MRHLHRSSWIPRRFIRRMRIQLTKYMWMLILLPAVLSQTAKGQHIDQNLYEKSLLDSAILYERIKPVHAKLKIAYEANRKYSDYLARRMQDERLQAELREKDLLRQRDAARKRGAKTARRTFVFGFGAGVLVGILIK